MKTIYLLLATALLTSCTGADLEKNEGVNDKTIVGTWEYYAVITEFQGNVSDINVNDEAKYYITLNADGTFQAPGPFTNCDTGTYTLVNNTIVTVYDCPNGILSPTLLNALPSYDYGIILFENNIMVLNNNWEPIIDSSSFRKYRKFQ